MDPKDKKLDVDPDYVRNNTAVRNVIKKEDEGKVKVSILFFMLILFFF